MSAQRVVIVGGGVTGLSAAWWLARSGVDVTMLDKGIVGWEASGRNGGGCSHYQSPLFVEELHGLHTVESAACFKRVNPAADRNARCVCLRNQCGTALRRIPNFKNGSNGQSLFMGEERCFQTKIMRPRNHQPLARKGGIARQQHAQGCRTHDTRLVPARERHWQVPCSRRERQVFESHQP